jgi:hypothetical protein
VADNHLVHFANSNSYSSSIAFVGGTAQIREPGTYRVVVKLELADADVPSYEEIPTSGALATEYEITTPHSQVGLYLFGSQLGMCNSSCGECIWGAVPETDDTLSAALVAGSIHGPSSLDGKDILIDTVVTVPHRCMQLGVYNKSYNVVQTVTATDGGTGAPNVVVSQSTTADANITLKCCVPVSFSIVKVA